MGARLEDGHLHSKLLENKPLLDVWWGGKNLYSDRGLARRSHSPNTQTLYEEFRPENGSLAVDTKSRYREAIRIGTAHKQSVLFFLICSFGKSMSTFPIWLHSHRRVTFVHRVIEAHHMHKYSRIQNVLKGILNLSCLSRLPERKDCPQRSRPWSGYKRRSRPLLRPI